jgi:amidase
LDHAPAQGGPVGPLHGIPMVIKDCLETADMPTSFGSEIFAEYRADGDAAVVTRLRTAGAIILAKTTLPDWATSCFAYSSRSGETKNPYDLSCDPGGSSGGTGAAVSTGYAAAGLGTDCGGSVRVPSSFCNLVGARSTPGLISRAGCNPLVGFQDTIGPIGRCVTDVVRVFDVIAGFDPNDPLTYVYSVARAPDSYLTVLKVDGLAGMRLGVVRNAFGPAEDANSAPVNQLINAAINELAAAGAAIVEVEIPNLPDWLVNTSLYLIKSKYDMNQFLAARSAAPMKSVNEIVASQRYHKMLDLLEGMADGPEDPFADPAYYPAYVAREEFMKTVVNLMTLENTDALVYPTVQVVPPKRADTDAGVWTTLTFPTNTLISSQTWMPALTVPAGLTDKAYPSALRSSCAHTTNPPCFESATPTNKSLPTARGPHQPIKLPGEVR